VKRQFLPATGHDFTVMSRRRAAWRDQPDRFPDTDGPVDVPKAAADA
jgi:hypothetical protein